MTKFLIHKLNLKSSFECFIYIQNKCLFLNIPRTVIPGYEDVFYESGCGHIYEYLLFEDDVYKKLPKNIIDIYNLKFILKIINVNYLNNTLDFFITLDYLENKNLYIKFLKTLYSRLFKISFNHFGSLFYYIKSIKSCTKLLNYYYLYPSLGTCFFRECLNKIIEYKDSLKTISDLFEFKKFLEKCYEGYRLTKQRINFEMKAIEILLNNNIKKTNEERVNMFNNLINKYTIETKNSKDYYNKIILLFIESNQFFKK